MSHRITAPWDSRVVRGSGQSAAQYLRRRETVLAVLADREPAFGRAPGRAVPPWPEYVPSREQRVRRHFPSCSAAPHASGLAWS